jgi:hypothetical protein
MIWRKGFAGCGEEDDGIVRPLRKVGPIDITSPEQIVYTLKFGNKSRHKTLPNTAINRDTRLKEMLEKPTT